MNETSHCITDSTQFPFLWHAGIYSDGLHQLQLASPQLNTFTKNRKRGGSKLAPAFQWVSGEGGGVRGKGEQIIRLTRRKAEVTEAEKQNLCESVGDLGTLLPFVRHYYRVFNTACLRILNYKTGRMWNEVSPTDAAIPTHTLSSAETWTKSILLPSDWSGFQKDTTWIQVTPFFFAPSCKYIHN